MSKSKSLKDIDFAARCREKGGRLVKRADFPLEGEAATDPGIKTGRGKAKGSSGFTGFPGGTPTGPNLGANGAWLRLWNAFCNHEGTGRVYEQRELPLCTRCNRRVINYKGDA